MRCPDTAGIYDYFDLFGAYHRRIVHAPVPGVTVNMARWFVGPFLPLLSPLINCMGRKMEYWYHCWHPIDHIALIPFPGASPDVPTLPAIYVRIWEHYRSTNKTVPDFELNMPMQAMDPTFNQYQVRVPFPIPGKGPGIILSAFNSLYEDTPEGLKVTTEFIVGSDQPGINVPLNLIAESIIQNQFYGLSDQVARHSIEEWGNMQYFLPELYARYHPFGGPGGK
ncbi:hypothetical protein FOA52_008129 [Chlamydomonas sp. UWO 241]|nr:hypothetical protein FOA52_008129 [Chlamydomonas sp. UWO 241]